MRVGGQDVPRLDTLAPNTSHRPRLVRTQQVVAFKLSNLALVPQPSLLCYPVGYHIQVHTLFTRFFLIMWARAQPDSPGLTQAAGE